MLAPPPVDKGRQTSRTESVRFTADRYNGSVGFLLATTIHVVALLVLALMVKSGAHERPVLTMFTIDDIETSSAMARFSDEAPLEPPVESVETDSVMFQPAFDEMIEIVDVDPPDLTAPEKVSVDRPLDNTKLSANNKPKSDVQFFGTHAYGNKFVYVMDVSGSMGKGNGGRIQRARAELIRSVNSLQPHHSFYVVLYSGYAVGMYGEWKSARLQPATPENKVKVARWISQIRPAGGTLPAGALKIAGDLVPDAVFFLSDGEFVYEPTGNMAMEQFIRSFGNARSRKIPKPSDSPKQVLDSFAPEIAVHTIAFESHASRVTMEMIAREKGGEFRFVPAPQAAQQPRRPWPGDRSRFPGP